MILVTGASGLLGLQLLKQLSQTSNRIRALYRNQIPSFLDGTQSDNIEWFQADVLDIPQLEAAFADINYVYHCAAIVSYDSQMLETMMNINVEGTTNVVNFCLDKHVIKLIHTSSISSLGKSDGNLISEKNEFDEKEAASNYAKSKFESEMEVWRGIAEGLNAVIVNPSIILGEADWHKSSSNLFKIVHDEFPYYTQGASAWVDVEDVANVMILLMQSNISNERFIVSGFNESFKNVFSLIASCMHKKPPSILAKPWMSEIVWRLSYLKSKITGSIATITKETARSAHQVAQYDNRKLLDALTFFQYQPLEKSIARIAKYYMSKIQS
jgi:dihydroflavonol-4-reductase